MPTYEQKAVPWVGLTDPEKCAILAGWRTGNGWSDSHKVGDKDGAATLGYRNRLRANSTRYQKALDQAQVQRDFTHKKATRAFWANKSKERRAKWLDARPSG